MFDGQSVFHGMSPTTSQRSNAPTIEANANDGSSCCASQQMIGRTTDQIYNGFDRIGCTGRYRIYMLPFSVYRRYFDWEGIYEFSSLLSIRQWSSMHFPVCQQAMTVLRNPSLCDHTRHHYSLVGSKRQHNDRTPLDYMSLLFRFA